MDRGRIKPNIDKKKPRLILDNRFLIRASMEIGQKGQMRASVLINSERLKFQDDLVERKMIGVRLLEFELITDKEKRVF